MLQAYIKCAETTPFGWIGICMAGYPNSAACDFAGDVELEEAGRDTLALLNAKLQKSIDNWSLPEQDPKLDKSWVVYNVAHDTLGFDYINWLVDAEMTRRREGAPAPLKVAFWFGRSPVHYASRDGWVNNVFRPALDFIGAVEDNNAIVGHHKAHFGLVDVCQAFARGEEVPKFGFKHPGIEGHITITLRETRHYPHRNSNIEEWLKVAKTLEAEGESVVFVRDTAKAFDPLPGFRICPPASIDLHHRMSLYGSAKCNLMVGNGPFSLCLFSDRPWLQILSHSSDPSDSVMNPVFWRKVLGIEMGQQFPWQSPQQRIVWAADTYDNIMSAYKELMHGT